MNIKLMRAGAQVPTRATDGSAGYDLAAAIDAPLTIHPGESAKIPTGIAIALPSADLVALVYSRSGHGHKHGVKLANSVGVIDSDYRGEIVVALQNTGGAPYTVQPGERIAQMVVAPILLPELRVVEELDTTDRGSGGMGSTGLFKGE